jgi:hypothetical protein
MYHLVQLAGSELEIGFNLFIIFGGIDKPEDFYQSEDTGNRRAEAVGGKKGVFPQLPVLLLQQSGTLGNLPV